MISKNKSFDYDILMENGAILKPIEIEFHSKIAKEHTPQRPFKYYSDVLIALSFINLVKLNNQKTPLSFDHSMDFWRQIEPHYELYGRSRKRVVALNENGSSTDPALFEKFEVKFNHVLSESISSSKVELKELLGLIPLIDYLEDHLKNPLLYNFSVKFSPEFQQKLLMLYSMLSNTRAIVAIDHNAFVEDASHEAIKMDSITDYLARPEYVVNDALLYLNFKKLFVPFVSGRSSDVKIEKLLFHPLKNHFKKYSHNACQLVESLPEEFLNKLNPFELEEAFYLVQMDWLLGSEAGVLFKIREELYGIQEGYEKVFWPEYDLVGHKHSTRLHVCCHVNFEVSNVA